MVKLCERPGCSEHGAAAYGMVPEDLLFWIAPLSDERGPDARVLCRRHADAMVVPLSWTLDDRRDDQPRLFKPRPIDVPAHPQRQPRARNRPSDGKRPEQLQIDGTGEIGRPSPRDAADEPVVESVDDVPPVSPWQPEFDADDDLDGLLEVSSPLLARAFRGTDRPRT